MKKLTRKQLAKSLASGVSPRQIAAHLLATGRADQVPMLLKDTARYLEKTAGRTVAEITSAHALTDAARTQIVALVKKETGVTDVELIEKIDESLLGGVIVSTPELLWDTSLRTKLQKLKASV